MIVNQLQEEFLPDFDIFHLADPGKNKSIIGLVPTTALHVSGWAGWAAGRAVSHKLYWLLRNQKSVSFAFLSFVSVAFVTQISSQFFKFFTYFFTKKNGYINSQSAISNYLLTFFVTSFSCFPLNMSSKYVHIGILNI